MDFRFYAVRCLRVFLAPLALTVIFFIFALQPPPFTSPPAVLVITASPLVTSSRSLVTPQLDPGDFTRLIDLTGFRFLMDTHPCNKTPSLLVVVHSAPKNTEKRAAIRETWGSWSSQVRVLFVFGVPKSWNEQIQLEREQDQYHDIIQGNYIDKYRNMTYKHVMAFKWITYKCKEVEFILKTDDDVFINMPNLTEFLPFLPSSSLIFCDVIKHALVKRSWRSKWRVSYREYPNRMYPDYCAGWSVLYSQDVIRTLYARAQSNRYFWVDDVHLTGVMALQAGIQHVAAEPWMLEDRVAKKIIESEVWPNVRNFLIGPFDLEPASVKSLWRILNNSNSVNNVDIR